MITAMKSLQRKKEENNYLRVEGEIQNHFLTSPMLLGARTRNKKAQAKVHYKCVCVCVCEQS